MPLPSVPTAESLRTATLRHRFGDLFNPPGVTNFVGSVQAALDPCGLTSLAFPPLAMGEVGVFGASGGATTGSLFIDGEYSLAHRRQVEFSTTPDRIDRRLVRGDLEVATTTITPMDSNTVLERIRVTNTGSRRHQHTLTLALRGNVTERGTAWEWPQSPAEFDNLTTLDQRRGAVVYSSQHGDGAVVEGTVPPASRMSAGALEFDVDLAPGETREIVFAVALGHDSAHALADFDRLAAEFEREAARCRSEWDGQLAAAYTPGNDRFSGSLPRLETDDADVLRLYHTALWTLLFHQRHQTGRPDDVTYTTLGPRYWQTATFLWDISLASPMLAQLDPERLRTMMERWMEVDIHAHFGTDYLTGQGIGPWYSVNDYAMCRMAREYLRWTGDLGWLDKQVGGESVLNRIVDYATHWRELDTNGDGLADYGGVNNLLEAVGSYEHEVAGMNAANVENLRFAAELLGLRDRQQEAGRLRREARRLVTAVQKLYVRGAGYWRCRMPDGESREVRHCYDFATVLTTIADDLTPEQRSEMVGFFRRELQTPKWMRALSNHDLDATFSLRPDHQWTGAYAAWPAISLSALYRAGQPQMAAQWMRGLGKTMSQGPVAQAYFAEDVIAADGSGARKAPSEQPWINDWSCVAGAAFLDPIITGLFGVAAPLRGRPQARPQLSGALAGSRLRGLRHQGRLYDVDAGGLHAGGGPASPEARPPSERTL